MDSQTTTYITPYYCKTIKGCRGSDITDTSNTAKYRLSEKPIRNRTQIPIISEIVNDSNVQFMEKSKGNGMGALYMALPFTRGQAFIVSVLDAILSLTFYNEKLMRIIRTLITGIGNHRNEAPAENCLPGMCSTLSELTETSKQPIRTRYLGHMTGYQPMRDQYFLIRSIPETSPFKAYYH
eukprot:sb/3471651/